MEFFTTHWLRDVFWQQLCWHISALGIWAVRAFRYLIRLLLFTPAPTLTPPKGFPASGNGLWFVQPGHIWSRDFLPVGNGYLAAMLSGGTTQEITQLNIESLWSGGPFADPLYNGGNKKPSEQAKMAKKMRRIQREIFQSPAGDIDNIKELASDPDKYGSYAGAGYLLATMNTTGHITNYRRWLDLDHGLARASWTQDSANIIRTTFCSHPARACVQHVATSNFQPLPSLTYAFAVDLEPGLPAPNITCLSSNSLLVHGRLHESPPSMTYALVIQAFSSTQQAKIQCIPNQNQPDLPPNATLVFPSLIHTNAWIKWTGDTEYDMAAGDSAHQFSFRGSDPVNKLLSSGLIQSQDPTQYDALLLQHTTDIQNTLSLSFSLDLGQKPTLNIPTDVLRSRYTIDGSSSNAYLEWVLFNFGRYLLVASARGTLPANLQGKWAGGVQNAWGADYHSNINIQMNYWCAEVTGLSNLTIPLFNYFEKTWAPRGAETARVLYNISRGWVTHNEMNIFGHTGMKAYGNSAEWANYPESAAWMMFHIWDHFDHTNDIEWWQTQGWPLLKGVASFHLDKLIPDLYFNDSTLVVNPCNSPEQAPITFGCAHAQQVIWQMFNAVEKGFAASGDTDANFIAEVRVKRAQMDKGVKIGSWGQLQEWKVEKDSPTDTHRHLSHLIGLYPGYAIAGFDPSPSAQGTGLAGRYSKSQVLRAAAVTLHHRGNGTGLDADSGWEKVWRAAAWAQLGNSKRFYHELSYVVHKNFGASLLSLFNPHDPKPIFQIDANLGYPAAVMNALLQAPDVASMDTPLTITILPALPAQWPSGSIRGARVRGGITVDLQWRQGKLSKATLTVDAGVNVRVRAVRVVYEDRVIHSFHTSSGLRETLSGV